eukprot:scaffold86431_cov69-Phaeocystis_antarctica.AAC.6
MLGARLYGIRYKAMLTVWESYGVRLRPTAYGRYALGLRGSRVGTRLSVSPRRSRWVFLLFAARKGAI